MGVMVTGELRMPAGMGRSSFALRSRKRGPRGVPRVLVLGALGLICAGCGNGDPAPGTGGTDETLPTADVFLTLEVDVEIGNDPSAGPDYQFSEIESVLPVADGGFWVLDGVDEGRPPRLRVYDAAGTYVRDVGVEGVGPGDFLTPIGLALLPDGRVALRDVRPNRITLFEQDGSLSQTLRLDPPRRWPRRGSVILGVDTAETLWLPFSRRGPRPSAFLRLELDGSIVDSVPMPPLPEVDRDRLTVQRINASGTTSEIPIVLPYQPRATWAWSTSGHFAVARTDIYRITLMDTRGDARAVIERSVRPVTISDAERVALRARLTERLANMKLAAPATVPEMPRTKPPLRDLLGGLDGSLLVLRSAPSRLIDGEWVEEAVFDVFTRDARYAGSISLPHEVSLGSLRFTGDQLLAVIQGPLGVQAVRRYRVRWGGGDQL